MAIVRKEISDRTVFGKIMKYLFIGFNALMGIMMLSMCSSMANLNTQASDPQYQDAANAGAAIGAGIAVGSFLFLWVAGDIILGLFVLFTRRKKIIEVDE